MKVRYILKTKDRQGEYLKKEYDGKKAPNGWNHWMYWSKKKVEEYARKNNINGRIERVTFK